MKRYVREIEISKKTAKRIEDLLNNEPICEEDCFGEDEKISYTATFEDGYEMDVEVCGVQYEEGESNTAWSQAVLFKDGSEVCCSDVSDDFLGEWELETKEAVYVVNVIVKEDY